MAPLRTDVERALDELVSQEEGMRFQGLAVVIGKKLWPELIARQRKKDSGLDAYAAASLTPEKVGKGLAASITPTLNKISADAKTAKESAPDLAMLLFVTSAKVGNAVQRQWKEEIQRAHGLELHIIEREEIITLMLMPENASLLASFLHLKIEAEPQLADLIERTKRAAGAVTRTWARRTKGHPLMDLAAVRLDSNGAESADVLAFEQIDKALSESRRILLEGPAGRGKTTTLIQIAQRPREAGIPFIVELPAWTASRRPILEFIAGMPALQAEGLTAGHLARVLQIEPFLFLLNGWNEITESNSTHATDALRELEREFSSAGIIIATRTHHLTPPLPGAFRLRLLRLRRAQRTTYLASRLGSKAAELRSRLDADPSLDELTRTPFILSEVVSLFEAGADIPSMKIGVLAEVLRLQEQRDEHRNALQGAPIFGRQTDYLKALATEMTRRGAVALSEDEARAVVAAVTRKLVDRGQIEPAGAPAILATLTAHHVLERGEYPELMFSFEHQQLQEYYSSLDVRARLLDLPNDDRDAIKHYTADYVNEPRWAEPLRMIAETLAGQTGDEETKARNTLAGAKLVEMALAVDLVFAGELAQLCGAVVWNKVRAVVGERFRAIHAIRNANYQQCALAAMLATGADDFRDIIVPLLSGQDQQTRLRTYRLWSDIQVSSLGPNWRDQVRGWSDEARADFVSELLHHRLDAEVAALAVEDNCLAVKKAAVSALSWTGFDDALTRILESMDAQSFEELACQYGERMPMALRPKAIAAMRKFVATATDPRSRLQIVLDLIKLGETGLDEVVKGALAALPRSDVQNLGPHGIEFALNLLSQNDPAWVSEWVTTQVTAGDLYDAEEWLRSAPSIPETLVEKCLLRLESTDLKSRNLRGIIAVVAARADAKLAARVFAKLRDLRREVDAEPGQRHELEWEVMRQLEALFRSLPHEVAAAGLLSSVTSGELLDIRLATHLLSRFARLGEQPLRIADDAVRAQLREYLKSSVELVLRREDFAGEEKADLASSIAQVGKPEDIAHLVALIRADIERTRRGRAARAAGDRGPLGNGAVMSHAGWHITAVIHLDPMGAEQVLIDLLSESEYSSDAAAAMARDCLPKPAQPYGESFRYDLMWAAREGRIPPSQDDQRRPRFAAPLNAEIERQQMQNKPTVNLKELAMALAAVDGRGSLAAVLKVMSVPGKWDEYTHLSTAKRLLLAGVVLPTTTVFALVDSMLERTERWMQESDKQVLLQILALCPFVDAPAEGIAKIREVLETRRLYGYELRELVTALGESRSDVALEFLCELASNAQTFEYCEADVINAIAALDTPRSRELLLGFVDPEIRGIELSKPLQRENILVARLTELANLRPEVAARLRALCDHDLPKLNRHLLSKAMDSLGTSEALAANLNLLDDANRPPVPQGLWDQLEAAFVQRRPYGQDPNVFTQQARASNEIRARLFEMAYGDEKRRKSASLLLAQIERWRLEHGRPADEPRHPHFASGQPWPPDSAFRF